MVAVPIPAALSFAVARPRQTVLGAASVLESPTGVVLFDALIGLGQGGAGALAVGVPLLVGETGGEDVESASEAVGLAARRAATFTGPVGLTPVG
jgi:hypothetical protein